MHAAPCGVVSRRVQVEIRGVPMNRRVDVDVWCFPGWRHSWAPQAMASASTVRRAVLKPADTEKNRDDEKGKPRLLLRAYTGSTPAPDQRPMVSDKWGIGHSVSGVMPNGEKFSGEVFGYDEATGAWELERDFCHGPRHRPRPWQHRRHPRREDHQGGGVHGRQVHPAQDTGQDRRSDARGRRHEEQKARGGKHQGCAGARR